MADPESARIAQLEAAIRLAQLIRPDNWNDGDDPQQEAAWRELDVVMAAGRMLDGGGHNGVPS